MKRLSMVPLLILMVGCAATTTPVNVPTAPLSQQAQVNVLNADKLLADAVNGAVKAVIQLRDQGKVTQADTVVVQNYCVIAAKFSNGLDDIVVANDIWSVQRGKIVTLIQNTALPVIGANVSPTAAAVVSQVATLIGQVRAQVGL
jgi:hypothetical protein